MKTGHHTKEKIELVIFKTENHMSVEDENLILVSETQILVTHFFCMKPTK